jgi:hypothetical protein
LTSGGCCIIRSAFLGNIKTAFDKDENSSNLLLDDYFIDVVTSAKQGWREVVGTAAMQGISVPCLSSALSYLVTLMVTVQLTLQLACYKDNVITLVLIRMSVKTSHVANSSIPTGLVEVVTHLLELTMYNILGDQFAELID